MKWRILGLVVFLVAIIAAWKLFPLGEYLQSACDAVEQWGPWAAAIYFVLYTLLVLIACPTTPLNIGAGVIFGVTTGFIVASTASLLGSCLCFLIARYVARDWFLEQTRATRSEWLLDAVNEGGFQVMLLARLNPFFPASIKDFGFGLTKVSIWQYAAATLLGQSPIVLAYTYLGWSGAVTISEHGEIGVWRYVLIGVGLVTSVALTGLLTWYSRRKMAAPA